jgi:CubicO group peptidase (beta-lactamase class C family)
MAAIALAAAAAPLAAQSSRAPVARASNGFNAERLARVDRFLQQYVDSNRIGGAVALVLRDGQVAYQKSVGWVDREARRPMTPDAMFRIASQSKAITSTAVLLLVEEGRIALGDPVSRFIPAYAHTTVASRADSGRTIVPARRQITIQDLLTHTAGISYGGERWVADQYAAKGLGPAAGNGWYTADKTEPVCETMERLATLPFIAQPGEAFVYGYNTDILGCVVERASGLSLDEFIRTRITGPLGMTDTYFFLPPAKASRLVTLYMNDSAGRVARAPEGSRGQGHYVEGPRRSFSGGAGDRLHGARLRPVPADDPESRRDRRRAHSLAALRRSHDVGPAPHDLRAEWQGLRTRVRDRGAGRRDRLLLRRQLRMGRRLRQQLHGRSRRADGRRLHDQPDAEQIGRRLQVSHPRVSGVDRRRIARGLVRQTGHAVVFGVATDGHHRQVRGGGRPASRFAPCRHSGRWSVRPRSPGR